MPSPTPTASPEILAPNFSASGLVSDGRPSRIKVPVIKFHADPKSTPAQLEALGRAEVEKKWCEGEKYTFDSVTIKKLPKPKVGAKLSVQHDYITLNATFLEGKLRLTASRCRTSLSGDFMDHPAGHGVLAKLDGMRDKMAVGKLMDQFLAEAQKHQSFAAFAEAVATF